MLLWFHVNILINILSRSAAGKRSHFHNSFNRSNIICECYGLCWLHVFMITNDNSWCITLPGCVCRWCMNSFDIVGCGCGMWLHELLMHLLSRSFQYLHLLVIPVSKHQRNFQACVRIRPPTMLHCIFFIFTLHFPPLYPNSVKLIKLH